VNIGNNKKGRSPKKAACVTIIAKMAG
jgi:hypothetical protein